MTDEENFDWVTRAFHKWLKDMRNTWRQFNAIEGTQITFPDYLNAYDRFMKEQIDG